MFPSIYETLVSLVFLYIFLQIVKTVHGHFASHISYCKKKRFSHYKCTKCDLHLNLVEPIDMKSEYMIVCNAHISLSK